MFHRGEYEEKLFYGNVIGIARIISDNPDNIVKYVILKSIYFVIKIL